MGLHIKIDPKTVADACMTRDEQFQQMLGSEGVLSAFGQQGLQELWWCELFEQEWRYWNILQPESQFKEDAPRVWALCENMRNKLREVLGERFQAEYEKRQAKSFFSMNGKKVPLYDDQGRECRQ